MAIFEKAIKVMKRIESTLNLLNSYRFTAVQNNIRQRTEEHEMNIACFLRSSKEI